MTTTYSLSVHIDVKGPLDTDRIQSYLDEGAALYWSINGVEAPHLPTDAIPEASQLLSPETFANKTHADLESIRQRLQNGANYSDMESIIDQMLGTEMPERDEALESQWMTRYESGEL
jgi:hypothetical protein